MSLGISDDRGSDGGGGDGTEAGTGRQNRPAVAATRAASPAASGTSVGRQPVANGPIDGGAGRRRRRRSGDARGALERCFCQSALPPLLLLPPPPPPPPRRSAALLVEVAPK